MTRLLFHLRTSTGVMDRNCCESLNVDDARGIRAHAKVMATQAVDAGADLDDLTVHVIYEEPTGDNPVVAILNCYRLVNLPM